MGTKGRSPGFIIIIIVNVIIRQTQRHSSINTKNNPHIEMASWLSLFYYSAVKGNSVEKTLNKEL